MGCFYCDEHHEGREAIMFKVGEMKAGVLYLFKDQAHKGRCALALKAHKKELCECTDQERADFAEDLAKASGAIKELWGCTKLNLGSFGDTNPHLHFHIVPKYEGGFEFGGFAVGNVEHTFTFPNGAAAEFIHVLGEDDFVTAFLQEGDHLVYQRLLHGGFFRESHGLVDAAGEINYFVQLTIDS